MENKASNKTEESCSSHNWSEDDEDDEEVLLAASAMQLNWSEQDTTTQTQSRDSSSNNNAAGTKKRERLTNWSPEERSLFHAVVQEHLHIVQDKANDTASVAKKKRAWSDIHDRMVAAGYNRPADKLRQAWSRRKVLNKTMAPTKKLPTLTLRKLNANKSRPGGGGGGGGAPLKQDKRPRAEGHAMQTAEMHFLRKKLLEKQIEAEERRLAHINLLIEKDAIIKSLEIQKLKLSMHILA